MIIYKQELSKFQLFLLAFAALILILMASLQLRIKPAIGIYLIFNLLVLVLGVESGLLKALSKPSADSNLDHPIDVGMGIKSSPPVNSSKAPRVGQPREDATVPAIVEMSLGSKIKLKSNQVNCSPSLFFVGNDGEAEWESPDDVNTGQELLTRADDFIEKFYKHLKMQREMSLKKLHDLCI